MNGKRLHARKRFGQNFLHDQMVIVDIIDAIGAEKDQHLVEIGPGRAALTKYLIEQCQRLDVIELDRDLVPLLQQQFKQSHFHLHAADALTFDYQTLYQDQPMRLVGNLPYNITTPLLFYLVSQAELIEDMCFMLQLEVVRRICAQPGTKNYGRLSIMMQYYCEVSELFVVPPTAFTPQPKVDSAIIYLRPITANHRAEVDITKLDKVVTAAFTKRRKTIANTLKNIISPSQIEECGIELSQRPETITLQQYIHLAKCFT